ncbi:MAG: sugar phosphate isomerase/epimerase [Magnetococcales bacterium]|nr:sugar phosphate isomerase/epimerase [Magnetococcales bacterium]
MVDGKIQAFPWSHWREEFKLANSCGLKLMEWTLDQDRLYENPLLTPHGQSEIIDLCEENQLSIPSLTGDCFMQAPFWKSQGAQSKSLQDDFMAIAKACSLVNIRYIVVPLVDNGRIDNLKQEDNLITFLTDKMHEFKKLGVVITFESDFAPDELKRFIKRLPNEQFGINYDIGNSGALGFNFEDEINAYGQRVLNVHVKDRLLGGTTVPLGEGNAQLQKTIAKFESIGYRGNYILQTARAVDNNHLAILCNYRDMVHTWMGEA